MTDPIMNVRESDRFLADIRSWLRKRFNPPGEFGKLPVIMEELTETVTNVTDTDDAKIAQAAKTLLQWAHRA